jgi:hypothetical protein
MVDIKEKVANRITAHVQAADDNFAIDPITIVAIINVIVSVIRLIYVCYWSEEKIAHQIKKQSVIHSLVLSREIRKHFPDKTRKERKVLYNAFKNVGSGLSELELNNLVGDVIGEKK